MKRSYVFLAMIVLGTIATMHAMRPKFKKTTEEEKAKKEAERKEAARQKDLARPDVYKMVDVALLQRIPTGIDWPVVFSIIDSMQHVIDVNEYYTSDGTSTLLGLAVAEDNVLAVNRLLEVYGANPNAACWIRFPRTTALMLACARGNVLIVKSLLKYGGNPNLYDAEDYNSFDYARRPNNSLEIIKIINSFNQ